jgi:hypothetical protein
LHTLFAVGMSCACTSRFTGGFLPITMAAQVELAENQWVVLLQQHYCAREL